MEVILGLKNQIISDKAFVSTSKIKAEDQGRNIISPPCEKLIHNVNFV